MFFFKLDNLVKMEVYFVQIFWLLVFIFVFYDFVVWLRMYVWVLLIWFIFNSVVLKNDLLENYLM